MTATARRAAPPAKPSKLDLVPKRGPAALDPAPRTMFISVAGRRRDAYTDAADRKRAKTRDRKRRERERKQDDGNVVRVQITVDYELGCRLVREGVLDEWSMEDRAAVQAALQAYLDQRSQYE